MFPEPGSKRNPRPSNQPEYLELNVEAKIEVAVICEYCEGALDAHRNINDDDKIQLIIEPCGCLSGEVPKDALTIALHCLTLMTPMDTPNPLILSEGGFDIRTVSVDERRKSIAKIQAFLDGV